MEALLHGHVHLGLGLATTCLGGLFPVGLSLCQLSLQVRNHLSVPYLHSQKQHGCIDCSKDVQHCCMMQGCDDDVDAHARAQLQHKLFQLQATA